MTSNSMRSAVTLGSSGSSSSGLAASLPSLSCPGPALADTLAPDPLSLCDGNHPGAAPAVAPHPDVHLVEPATVVPVPLRVGRGTSKTPIVLEAVWNSRVTFAADETKNVTLHSVGLEIKAITKNIGQIADRGNIDARGTGLSSVAVTELLCSQVYDIQLLMFLSGFILIVF
jgi:hypothetical protein